ncbi:MAG: hypothetical protein KAT70_07130 [Thermoplasmata archaeon]|nr:hypothetical protein [Thermoplasmata archaeon]
MGRVHSTSKETLWLRSLSPEEGCKLKRHNYCSLCGTVKVKGEGRGRPVEHYIDLLDQVQKYLEDRRWLGVHPFVEVEKRLLVQRMRAMDLFSDPYGSYAGMQMHAFAAMLWEQRKGLSPRILDDILSA